MTIVPHATFQAAILDASLAVPEGLQDAQGAPAGARFSVYRNNVIVSLSEALATAFPLVKKLLGEGTFGQLAAVFVRAHPPTSPLMMFYGEDLPTFLEGFAPLKQIGYLPDCARLDLALRKSYHAADSKPFDTDQLQQEEEQARQVQMALAPATQIVRSAWPLFDLWRYNTDPAAPKPRAVAQDVLVTRVEFDPMPQVLPQGAADWLETINKGTAFGLATEQTLAIHPHFDLTQALTLALTSNALVNYTTKEI